MSFSDNDLKRLKDVVDNEKEWTRRDDEAVKALLARLEAAEAVIKEADDHGFTDKAIELETAWRKACGRR